MRQRQVCPVCGEPITTSQLGHVLRIECKACSQGHGYFCLSKGLHEILIGRSAIPTQSVEDIRRRVAAALKVLPRNETNPLTLYDLPEAPSGPE